MKPAWACSCVPAPPDEQAAQDADVVFTGTLIDADVAQPGITAGTWTFTVDTVYKGEIGREQEVRSETQSAACGLIFKEQKRYAVFAYEQSGTLQTNSCTNTRVVSDSKSLNLEPVLRFEGTPVAPLPLDQTSSGGGVIVAVIAITAIVVVATGLGIRRRKT